MKKTFRRCSLILITVLVLVFTTGCFPTKEETKRGEKLCETAKKAADEYISNKYNVIPKTGKAENYYDDSVNLFEPAKYSNAVKVNMTVGGKEVFVLALVSSGGMTVRCRDSYQSDKIKAAMEDYFRNKLDGAEEVYIYDFWTPLDRGHVDACFSEYYDGTNITAFISSNYVIGAFYINKDLSDEKRFEVFDELENCNIRYVSFKSCEAYETAMKDEDFLKAVRNGIDIDTYSEYLECYGKYSKKYREGNEYREYSAAYAEEQNTG
ncbi:MAG: hypothetical protein IKH96_06950 [Ruminococcus sp.]|uniref:hypothetical protein n=1 Tax=Ruminococcus sp. TaxID=41978 RepID=UPI002600C868|nr:hypothetical protein [Ruminococcus sp.]MBR6995745.1 hypothetical protein [Ruminococcus sp.]